MPGGTTGSCSSILESRAWGRATRSYSENAAAYNDPVIDGEANWAYREWMRDFCEHIEVGDLLVMRGPSSGGQPTVAAVGEVTSDYQFENGGRLVDVEGWDLSHYLKVRWHTDGSPARVPGITSRSRAVHRVNKAADRIRDLDHQWPEHPSRPLPPPAEPIKDPERLIMILIEEGLPTGQAESIAQTLWKVRRLAIWYRHWGAEISEHEIRSFVIVPLLLALGWAEQRIKIEWNHRDIALFDWPYGPAAQLQALVESKRLDGDLGDKAANQAARYALDHATCRQLLITDGFRYKLSRRVDDEWTPVAYINLLKLLDRHPYLEQIAGAQEFLPSLLPERLPYGGT